MKAIAEFLSYLCTQDIKLWVENDCLRCSAPKEALTPDIKAELVARKAEILAFISQANQALKASSESIQPVAHQGNIPLSFAQQRLWFFSKLEPESSAYNIPAAVKLTGKLNIVALSKSINEIIRRHEILRTTFTIVDGEPIQVISHDENFTLTIIDLQPFAEAQKQQEVRKLAALEAQKPFDLVKGPLVRASLLQLAETDYVVLLIVHHIVSDGWSTGIFIQELTALYTAYSQSQPSPLPKLPIQYADFTIWQRKRLQGELLQTQLNYWKQELGGDLPILELPTDYPRPAIQSNNGATQPFQLSKFLTEKLQDLSKQEGVTLFMTLLAAFKVLLYRYTQQEEIIVGTPIANRDRTEIESLIGFFVNTLVLRTNLGNNPSFKELLQQVREVTLGAYAHQELPFEKLVEELQPGRNLSHNPLFQVMFILQNAATEVLHLPELSIEPLTAEKNTANFDLTLSLTETEAGLKGDLEYNTDIFNSARINRMLGHFQVLLEGIVANPNRHLSELPLLTVNEQHQLLTDWSYLKIDYPQYQCIHQLFEAQVEITPDAIAVVFGNEYLTYQELNQKANNLAYYLQLLGVKPEVCVGICVEKSLEMVIGILGILKAGGAYLPLDPSYPKERLAFMMQDAQVSVLLTQTDLLQSLPMLPNQIINLDRDWQQIAQLPSSNPVNTHLEAANLAYIIYTSGSTGKPKGVMIQHSSLINAYFAWETTYQLRTNATSHLQMASFSFDVFSGDWIRALCSGGKLVLCPKDLLLSPEQLYQLIQKEKVDCAEFVPAVLRNLIKFLEHSQQRLDFMRLLICGSDSWNSNEYRKFLQFCSPQTRLINSYGLTEATIDSSYFETTAQNLTIEKLLPIGRPFPNTQFYILDKYLQPVPIGVAGELYIGGLNLARGYKNRPDLTAEKFIPHPFSQNSGDRLYKTGDLVRYLPDGNIEFIQRIDNQVKIRGFRIEISEIESAITQYSEIREAIVILREDRQDDKHIVAYVVPQSTEISILELRNFLKLQLPSYMIPTAFVVLEKILLTPNGKIDRRALPAPDPIRQLEETTSLTLTPVQEMLVGIWADILGIRQLGIYNNFFELGGHSLLATRVISQIRKAFQVDLPLRCLFESPTVAELANKIEHHIKSNLKVKLPHIGQTFRPANIPLSYAQQRLWYLHQIEFNNTAYNIFEAVHIIGSLNIAALKQSLNEVICRHEILRTNFIVEQGQPIQVISTSLNLELPIIDISNLLDNERQQTAEILAKQEAEKPFNLDTEPLLRVTLLRLSETEHVLLFTMHHIISDGWSMAVLIKEIVALYQAFSANQPSPLSEIPIQYADFAIWQHQWLQEQVLDKLLSYWQQQIQNLPTIKLATDYPRPLAPTYQGAAQSFTLSSTLSQQIKVLSNQQGVTLFMTLLAAFATLMHYYSEQDDIVIGTDVANRNQAETEGLIGFFVNQIVLRTKFDNDPSFQDLLKIVREMTLDAYAHQDLPFDKLVEAINPERNLHITPLFQVKLILQNTPQTHLNIPGLTFQTLETETKTVTFDLLFDIRDTEQGLMGLLKYSTDLFVEKTITRMLANFETILSEIVNVPNTKISELKKSLAQAEKQDRLTQEITYQNSLKQKLNNIRRRSTNSNI
ncbi:non-ribosomal peptide synthetase [Calothrix sp. NIES-2098]|uniref:non-ribosomal peptide synthetase n=1 Tax=Calothrix sp. NIES-2098 TaxID=1954171 RepID=UPI000B5DE717|nr:amino acid adenylation domain-containing protein [Calothrix sp. NIES-2098]